MGAGWMGIYVSGFPLENNNKSRPQQRGAGGHTIDTPMPLTSSLSVYLSCYGKELQAQIDRWCEDNETD